MDGNKLNRVIFTCGGTAGHINPALALAQLMKEQNPETEFLFVGAERGLEKDLVPKAGYAFETVHISSFHRSFKPKEIKHNLISVKNNYYLPLLSLKRFWLYRCFLKNNIVYNCAVLLVNLLNGCNSAERHNKNENQRHCKQYKKMFAE